MNLIYQKIIKISHFKEEKSVKNVFKVNGQQCTFHGNTKAYIFGKESVSVKVIINKS